MRHKRVGESRSEYLLTVPRVWTEESSPMPSTHRITAWEAPINILFFEVFGKAETASEAVTMENLRSAKAVESENSPADRDVRVQQACRQRRPYHHRFGKWIMRIKRWTIAGVTGH